VILTVKILAFTGWLLVVTATAGMILVHDAGAAIGCGSVASAGLTVNWHLFAARVPRRNAAG
jgi:hypothetical protein